VSNSFRERTGAISNLKAWMHGTHRGVGEEHLAVYLDEYVFRHNRRATPMAAFQTLLGLRRAPRPDDLRPDHPEGRLTQTERTGYALHRKTRPRGEREVPTARDDIER